MSKLSRRDRPEKEIPKGLKYRPSYPDRFGSLVDAREWALTFFAYSNHEHRHSGIGLLTPAMVHRGQAVEQVAARAQVLEAAYAAHPERFVRGCPRPPEVPTAVWINPPSKGACPPERCSTTGARTGPMGSAGAAASRVSAAHRPLDAAVPADNPGPGGVPVGGDTNAP